MNIGRAGKNDSLPVHVTRVPVNRQVSRLIKIPLDLVPRHFVLN